MYDGKWIQSFFVDGKRYDVIGLLLRDMFVLLCYLVTLVSMIHSLLYWPGQRLDVLCTMRFLDKLLGLHKTTSAVAT